MSWQSQVPKYNPLKYSSNEEIADGISADGPGEMTNLVSIGGLFYLYSVHDFFAQFESILNASNFRS